MIIVWWVIHAPCLTVDVEDVRASQLPVPWSEGVSIPLV